MHTGKKAFIFQEDERKTTLFLDFNERVNPGSWNVKTLFKSYGFTVRKRAFRTSGSFIRLDEVSRILTQNQVFNGMRTDLIN